MHNVSQTALGLKHAQPPLSSYPRPFEYFLFSVINVGASVLIEGIAMLIGTC